MPQYRIVFRAVKYVFPNFPEQEFKIKKGTKNNGWWGVGGGGGTNPRFVLRNINLLKKDLDHAIEENAIRYLHKKT